MGSKAERTRRRYRNLLKSQQRLEELGFTQAEPQNRSRATINTAAKSFSYPSSPDTTSSALVDQKTEPNSPESTPNFKIEVDDDNLSISSSDFTMPLSEPDDNIHVRQETPDPPVLEFNVQTRQESLTPPPLHFEVP